MIEPHPGKENQLEAEAIAICTQKTALMNVEAFNTLKCPWMEAVNRIAYNDATVELTK